jgi:hypothetical protein
LHLVPFRAIKTLKQSVYVIFIFPKEKPIAMSREIFKRASEETKLRQRREAINRTNIHGTNMFFEAIESGRLDEVRKLYREGAELDTRTTARGFISSMTVSVPYGTGATPLHAACLLGAPDIVEFLIEKGADVRAKDDEGHTPLDYAILSHSYYEAEFDRKASSRFAFQRTVDKMQSKVEDYEKVILQIQRHGGKPAMFALPEKFGALKRAGKLPPPSLP